jgi:transcriptional regulator with XRE-family HTH domain
MKTPVKKLLGARIKELRKQRKLSQDQLSEKVDIDPKHLSRLEVGNSFPSLDTLDNIAKSLGVEMKDFFEFEHEVRGNELKDKIKKLLDEADENRLRLILKVARALVR